MNVVSRLRWACPILACVAGVLFPAYPQGTMRRPNAETEDKDSNGDLKKVEPNSHADTTAHGSVLMADGSAPQELVEVFGGCGGVQRFLATADAKGRFAFNIKGMHAGTSSPATGCAVRASLEGFRSGTTSIPDVNAKSALKIGKLVLQPLTSDSSGFHSGSDANKSSRKLFESALDEAAGQDWTKAMAALQKATVESPGFSPAWLVLGILRQSGGDRANAEKSFLEAIRADPKYALPLIRAAALEATQGDWRATLDHSQHAIDLNPAAFPNAYALNAMANIGLQNTGEAEKSALAGLKLDTDHQYPELEYSLGIVLYSRNDLAGAIQHLQSYVDRSPNGSNAAGTRTQLAQMRAASSANAAAAPDQKTAIVKEPQPSPPAKPDANIGLFQERNAPLLSRIPAHMCLESISRAQVDLRGKMHGEEAIRVDVAVSEGKEIYGEAGGNRFSKESLANMLGYTFSTTGLFNSLARALIAGNQVDIQPAGEEVLNGEQVLRYNFRTVPGSAGWFIQYGRDSGRAAEQGWFLVDSASLTLRRVSAQAVDMPPNLKVKNLQVAIDYEVETIAGQRVLLPEMADIKVEETAGTQRLSRVFFNHCHAFGADSQVSFNEQESGSQTHRPIKPELPPGLDVTLSLLSPMNPATAADNDVVQASVAKPIVVKGRELIARGALVEGHVLPRRGANEVMIEFDRVQTRDGWAVFYAYLVSPAPLNRLDTARKDKTAGAKLNDPQIPGVATLAFASQTAGLEKGALMTWKTETLSAASESQTPQLNTTIAIH